MGGLKAHEVAGRATDLRKIEDLGAILEEKLILDNRYTEHSTVGLVQQWDQLNQLGMRIRHNLEQQIQARNQSGVSEDALKEFSMMFRHFDKDKTGRLDLNAFKSCLRALGYDLPMVEESENAFRAITAQEREYVTQEELYSNLSKEMADYCIARMKPYVDPRTGQGITGALDYMEFTRTLFS